MLAEPTETLIIYSQILITSLWFIKIEFFTESHVSNLKLYVLLAILYIPKVTFACNVKYTVVTWEHTIGVLNSDMTGNAEIFLSTKCIYYLFI